MSFQLFLSYASKQCITLKALKHKKEMWLLKILDTFSLFKRFFEIIPSMYVVLNIQIMLNIFFGISNDKTFANELLMPCMTYPVPNKFHFYPICHPIPYENITKIIRPRMRKLRRYD